MVGMTDVELENLSRSRLLGNGWSVWAAWESERTSYGKTFREKLRYPSFLPLFFSSDHYVDMLTSIRSNEILPTYPLYFSWNYKKCKILRDQFKVNALHIEHPWVSYRQKYFPRHSQTGVGTLLFWPHSHGGLKVNIDFNLVKKEIEKIPQSFHPLSICVSALDVDMGIHKKLRALGYPIYTAGNVLSQKFVDRFYSLLNNFRYAGGFYIGSHIYYCHEFGVPYIALDYKIVNLESVNDEIIPDGSFDFIAKDYPDEVQREIFESWYNTLKQFSNEVSNEQLEFARQQLGCYSTTEVHQIRKIVYYELLRHAHRIPMLYFNFFKDKKIKLKTKVNN